MKLSLIILTLTPFTATVCGQDYPLQFSEELNEEANVNKDRLLNAAIQSLLNSARMNGEDSG